MRHLILDRDSKFTSQFKTLLKDAGVKVVPICYQAPNINAIAERWVLSVRNECIDRMILFGEASLCRALREYCAHFLQERPHQGMENNLIAPRTTIGSTTGVVTETEHLRGLLRS